jgi:hypothetical protein
MLAYQIKNYLFSFFFFYLMADLSLCFASLPLFFGFYASDRLRGLCRTSCF